MGLVRVHINDDVDVGLHVRADVADLANMVDGAHRVRLDARWGAALVNALAQFVDQIGRRIRLLGQAVDRRLRGLDPVDPAVGGRDEFSNAGVVIAQLRLGQVQFLEFEIEYGDFVG